jgi:hypothetical protein
MENKVNMQSIPPAFYPSPIKRAKEIKDKKQERTATENKDHNCWFLVILLNPTILL